MVAFVGAGLLVDMFGESEPKPKTAKKAAAKKKTTKKATKAADE